MPDAPRLRPPGAAAIETARRRLAGVALETPLLALDTGAARLWLKPECLQPGGSFKIRPAASVALALSRRARARGLVTASSGNLGIALAHIAACLGVPATVVVPAHAPANKRAQIARLGARVLVVSARRWWEIATGRRARPEGCYVDAVTDPRAIAGSATVGAEIAAQAPDVATVLVPFGGGGLAVGVAAALRALAPRVRVVACEIDTAAPLTASLAAGRPVRIRTRPSFVSGIGMGELLPWMWPLARELVDATAVVSPAEVAAAIRLLAERAHIVAEGAGAVAVAAALAGRAGPGRLVCVVSGGNLDAAHLATIMAGHVPDAPAAGS